MTIHEWMRALRAAYEDQIYRLVLIGFKYSEIPGLSMSFGQDCIRKYYEERNEERLIDDINFFSAHGIDVSDTRVMGTDVYKEFLDKQKERKFEAMERRFSSKIEKMKKQDPLIFPEIDHMIGKKRLQHGRKT